MPEPPSLQEGFFGLIGFGFFRLDGIGGIGNRFGDGFPPYTFLKAEAL
jgi:hypothetical protein